VASTDLPEAISKATAATPAVVDAQSSAIGRTPVNADITDVETILVPEGDLLVNELGIKGLGELGNVQRGHCQRPLSRHRRTRARAPHPPRGSHHRQEAVEHLALAAQAEQYFCRPLERDLFGL
jgi:hypothetical protein